MPPAANAAVVCTGHAAQSGSIGATRAHVRGHTRHAVAMHVWSSKKERRRGTRNRQCVMEPTKVEAHADDNPHPCLHRTPDLLDEDTNIHPLCISYQTYTTYYQG